MAMGVPNGSAHAHAVSIIKDEKATQHQKLDAILYLLLSNNDRIKGIEACLDANPFSSLKPSHRGKVYAFMGIWFVAMSLAFAERVYYWLQQLGWF